MLRLNGPRGWTNGTLIRGLGLSMVVMLAAAACSSSSSSPSASAAAPTTAASQAPVSAAPSAAASPSAAGDLSQYIGKPDPALCGGKTYVIGYDSFSDTESFAVALKQGLEKAAADLGCVTIKALVDNADAATAVQNAKVLAQQKVDGAILFNVIQAASTGQSQALKAANIPLVSLAVPVDGYPFITNDDFGQRHPGRRGARRRFQGVRPHRGRGAHRALRRPGLDQATRRRRDPGPQEHGA